MVDVLGNAAFELRHLLGTNTDDDVGCIGVSAAWRAQAAAQAAAQTTRDHWTPEELQAVREPWAALAAVALAHGECECASTGGVEWPLVGDVATRVLREFALLEALMRLGA